MKRLLIYGGSFNPPHIGHADALRCARKELDPDRTLVIPGAVPPHKQPAAGSPDSSIRLELCRLAFGKLPGVEVSDMELQRGGISYSVDTLEALREQYPGWELIFLMGTDMLLSLPAWHRPERIMELATVAVLPREKGETEEIERFAEQLRREYGAKVRIVSKRPLPLSSTEVRAALPERGGREYLRGDVYADIIRRRCYGARPELAWLREDSGRFLKKKRIPHVRGCEQTAAELAVIHGADPDTAAEAAILHDVTKKLSEDEQLRLCEKYDIIMDTAERAEPKLWHAITGAAFARAQYGADEAVCTAIRWHTTGRAGMSTLEKIIYLADTIEPNRDYPGVEELRQTARADLDEAMIRALQMSNDVVSARGDTPHRHSMEALEWSLREKGRLL